MCGGQGGRTIFGAQRALNISIYCNDATWTGHLELQIGVMRYRIEAGKSSSFEQCVIAAAEGDDVEDQVFASEVVRRSEGYFQHD